MKCCSSWNSRNLFELMMHAIVFQFLSRCSNVVPLACTLHDSFLDRINEWFEINYVCVRSLANQSGSDITAEFYQYFRISIWYFWLFGLQHVWQTDWWICVVVVIVWTDFEFCDCWRTNLFAERIVVTSKLIYPIWEIKFEYQISKFLHFWRSLLNFVVILFQRNE